MTEKGMERGGQGEAKPPEGVSREGPGQECRCKEATRRTLPELLRLMARDLAFWKKNTDNPKG